LDEGLAKRKPGNKRQQNISDVLPLDDAIATAAGIEPALSVPEVSVAYTTGSFLILDESL
jgi:hypothetical protein